ncbi:MAG: bifunctional diaminohydroxyphosphoribosylaminopyrimidine deaminase/5-amino-6-(5-phosphoribosylamino)uracil reductase RibD [Clostridiales bacterium]|nr:bifunctional diaminohydroxyphosphoribosylaminopyrimidine deaminase/5-amino-6-(5-phosphoribosylamino)uracil reductase RibD [Clostridiales bacterium]
MSPEQYMKRALELAERGRGRTSPNPVVGAVIVKDDHIIGEGWHKEYGGLHAEINAFLDAQKKGFSVEGAEMFVTLEPCAHYGKTPPCAKKIVEKKLKKVTVGLIDPNPLVGGKGISILEEAGIQVVTGVLEEECRKKNEIFLKYISTKTPFVVMKAAMTLDGKIAASSGDSKWISSDKSRGIVQSMRDKLTGIMVGINTVIMDQPQLTTRIPGGRNPVRIVVDSRLRIPENAEVLNLKGEDKCIVLTTEKADREKLDRLQNRGIICILCKNKEGHVDLQDAMKKLGEKDIDSILLEGGGTLNFSAIEEGIVDQLVVFIAPKLIGGKDAKTFLEGRGFSKMASAVQLDGIEMSLIGQDIIICGYPKKR